MKTNSTDKATARPWRVKSGFSETWVETMRGALVAQVFSDACVQAEEDANATLIVKAVNEHAALVAVAEAAKRAERTMESTYKTGILPTNGQCVTHYGELANALANLAAVREGGAK